MLLPFRTTHITTLCGTAAGNSDQWNSTYTTTKTNSANWSQAYTNLVANSANFGVYANEIHVSTDGNDTTGNGDMLRPFKTITHALTIVTAQRRKIIVHSGGYTETPTITQSYTTITSEQQKGDDVVIIGTMTTNVGCTIAGLKMDNLNIAAPIGTGAVNILGCDITGTLTKSSNTSYTLIRFCDIGTVNITGAGLVAMLGGNPNNITINNIAAQVVVKSTTTVAPVLSAGNANFVESIVIAAGATSNAIRTAAGTIVTLANSQFIVPLYNEVARVSLNGFYSIFNCIYDKPKSTLVTPSGTGGSTNSIDYFQYIDADKVITPNGNSNNWNAAYTNLVNNSGAYLSGFNAFDASAIAAASGSWNSTYTTTNLNSASWSGAYTSFNANSSFYDAAVNELFTYVISETGDEFITEDSLLMVDSNIDGYPAWNSTTETVISLSANWGRSSVTTSLSFGSISARGYTDQYITLHGASVGDAVFVTCTSVNRTTDPYDVNLFFDCLVSSVDTITIRAHNPTDNLINNTFPYDYRVILFK